MKTAALARASAILPRGPHAAAPSRFWLVAALAVAALLTLLMPALHATAACSPQNGPCVIPRVLDLQVASAGLIGGNTSTQQYFVDGVKVKYEGFAGKPRGNPVPSQVTVQVQYLKNGKSFKSVTVTIKLGQTAALPRVALPAGFRPHSECAPGNDRLTIKVDATNRVAETNEKNNVRESGGIIC